MIVEDIGLLNLHDSDLISITVRPTDEGDENISLRLDYLNDYQSFETAPKILVFGKCWDASLKMNFRYSGPDSILSAEELPDSDLIAKVRKRYEKMNLVPRTRLRHFVIKTNLTGSQIDIVAEELHLLDSVPND